MQRMLIIGCSGRWNFKRTHDAMMEETPVRDVAHAQVFRLRSDREMLAFMSRL